MAEQRLRLIIEALNKTDKEFAALKNSIAGIGSATAKTSQSSAGALDKLKSNWMAVTAAVTAAYIAYRKIDTVVSSSMRFLSVLETASLGIASSLMTQGKFIDQITGKALEGQAALAAAQGVAGEILKELQVENFKTIATLDQLVRAYQETLPVAMARGFNLSQIKEFTVGMVQAAGALGLQLDMLAEETRSLIVGTITPRTSRIAVALGLTNEDIRKHSKNATELFDFLMGKLAAFGVAGIESQKTWAGLWSNFKDVALQIGGQVFQPLFEQIKYELGNITASLITIDEKTKTIKWDPEFLQGIENFKTGLRELIADFYRLGMYIDNLGGVLTRIAALWPGERGEESRKLNRFLARKYQEKNVALQDLAMREQGYKPLDKQAEADYLAWANKGIINPKSKYYKEIAEKYKNYQEITIPGVPGVPDQLRIYQPAPTGAGAPYTQNPAKPNEDEEAAKAREKFAEQEAKAREEAEAYIAKSKLPEFERELYDIERERAELEKKYGVEQWINAQAEVKTAALMKKTAGEDFDKWLAERRSFADAAERIEKERESKEKAAAERRRAIAEAEIAQQLAVVEREEKNFEIIPKEAGARRIALHHQQLEHLKEQYGELAGVAGKELERLEILKEITAEEQKIVELKQRQKELAGTFTEGLAEGLKKYNANLRSGFQQGLDIVEQITQGMENAFGQFFDYTSEKFLDFRNLALDVLNDIYKALLRNLIVQPAVGGISSFLQTLLPAVAVATVGGAAGGGGPYTVTGNTPQFTAGYHAGGMGTEPTFYRIVPSAAALDFAPRYHGGVGPGEKAAIIRDDEGVFTPGQMRAMGLLSRESAGGDTINIHIDNKTGLPLNMRQTGMQRNEKQKTKDLFIELAYSDIDFINHLKGALSK